MTCPKCGMPLPNDSDFCQYCGVEIVEAIDISKEDDHLSVATPVFAGPAVVNSQQAEQSESSPEFSKDSGPDEMVNGADNPASHSTGKNECFCKKCGGRIDSATKKCKSCGKQYFRLKVALPIIILSLLLAALAGLNVIQHIYSTRQISGYEAQLDELDKTISEQQTIISEQQATLAEQESTISSQKATISSQERNISELSDTAMKYLRATLTLSFYEQYAVVVPDDGTGLYHTYGCDYLDTSYFWIYNVDAARDKGYKPCKYCQN